MTTYEFRMSNNLFVERFYFYFFIKSSSYSYFYIKLHCMYKKFNIKIYKLL